MLTTPLIVVRAHPAPLPSASTLRRASAAALQAASQCLHGLALRLAQAPVTPLLEFHAEAGAPEGALYVDGRLVGHLQGVTRL